MTKSETTSPGEAPGASASIVPASRGGAPRARQAGSQRAQGVGIGEEVQETGGEGTWELGHAVDDQGDGADGGAGDRLRPSQRAGRSGVVGGMREARGVRGCPGEGGGRRGARREEEGEDAEEGAAAGAGELLGPAERRLGLRALRGVARFGGFADVSVRVVGGCGAGSAEGVGGRWAGGGTCLEDESGRDEGEVEGARRGEDRDGEREEALRVGRGWWAQVRAGGGGRVGGRGGGVVWGGEGGREAARACQAMERRRMASAQTTRGRRRRGTAERTAAARRAHAARKPAAWRRFAGETRTCAETPRARGGASGGRARGWWGRPGWAADLGTRARPGAGGCRCRGGRRTQPPWRRRRRKTRRRSRKRRGRG